MQAIRGLLASFFLLVLTASLLGQSKGKSAPPPPDPAKANARLDKLLERWEAEGTRMKGIVVDVTSEQKNTVFNTTIGMTGTAKFMKLVEGSYGASIELRSNDPSKYEKYICTGSHIYNFQPSEKLIYVYTLEPHRAGQPLDDGVLPFLFGMKADVAKKRWRMEVKPTGDPVKDEWYTHLHVYPNFPRDQADYKYARVVVMNKPFKGIFRGKNVDLQKDMPIEILWQEPNGQVERTWNVHRIQRFEHDRDVPGAIERREFSQPALPRGWQWKYAQNLSSAPPKPRVIRPNGK